ncbi:MAG TPA: biopolymer transporter ExbD [Pyrinomonadaceae bacterium]|nr:biopolymer transporter ExbD [Acidobacteriota bacterium]HQZ97346.1 biopolymer transporter ExbD [Pyrinomonadaceae bacterium]
MNRPNINVTPLIDVLLVLLIIFMVVTPLKPSSFKTRIPSEQKNIAIISPNPDTLAVVINDDSSISLNGVKELGNSNDPAKLIDKLRTVFQDRVASGNISTSFADDPNRPFDDRIERTVFVKAPRSIGYGTVARVVDAVKLAGAYPISLQIDQLD